MRVKDGFVLREVAGQVMVIATGEASKDFHGMVKLNATGKRIWQGVSDGLSSEDIARLLAAEYNVSEEQALSDVTVMVERMRQAGFLCE